MIPRPFQSQLLSYHLLCSGTFTVLSIMVGSVTERLAPDENFFKTNGSNVTEVDTDARDSYRIQVAAATTVLGGLIQVRQHTWHLNYSRNTSQD